MLLTASTRDAMINNGGSDGTSGSRGASHVASPSRDCDISATPPPKRRPAGRGEHLNNSCLLALVHCLLEYDEVGA